MIILDLMMPGMSGFEVAGALKDDPATANIPILVLTSKEISADDRRKLQSKVSSFVQKGTSAREQLVREIRRLEKGADRCHPSVGARSSAPGTSDGSAGRAAARPYFVSPS